MNIAQPDPRHADEHLTRAADRDEAAADSVYVPALVPDRLILVESVDAIIAASGVWLDAM